MLVKKSEEVSMKSEYLKMVTRHMSSAYKKLMRDGIKELYVENLESDQCISCTIVPDDGTLDQDYIEEEVMDMILHCIRRGISFGDYKTTSFETDDGTLNPQKKWTAFLIALPISVDDESKLCVNK